MSRRAALMLDSNTLHAIRYYFGIAASASIILSYVTVLSIFWWFVSVVRENIPIPEVAETLITYIQTGGISWISIKIICVAVAAMRKPPKCDGCPRCLIDKFILHEGQMLSSMTEADFKEKQHCTQCFGFLAGQRKQDHVRYHRSPEVPIYIPPVRVIRPADDVDFHHYAHNHTPANAHG